MSCTLLAEFDDQDKLLGAIRALREGGYEGLQAYAPFHVEGLAELLPRSRGEWQTTIARLTFAGGVLGGSAIFAFVTWAMAWDWPVDVGGRAPFSWPAFIIPTFECTILGASLTAFVAFMVLSGFPRPHHPLFELAAFERASADRLFVAIAVDPLESGNTELRALLEGFSPVEIHELRA